MVIDLFRLPLAKQKGTRCWMGNKGCVVVVVEEQGCMLIVLCNAAMLAAW